MSKSKAKRERERKEKRFASAHEPTYDNCEEVVECGGELWWAVDFTSAGFPLGLRLSEMKEMEERDARSRRLGWAVARDVLRTVFGPDSDIGRVTKIGEGLSHDVFVAYVECPQPRRQDSGSYTVSLPGRHADSPQHTRPDLQHLLASVAAQTKSIRVPSMVQIVPLDTGSAIVRPFLEGVPLDLRAGRQPSVKPHEVVAKIAAAIHAVDVAEIELRGHRSRRAHAEAEIDAVFGAPELAEAELWAREHLPPDEPSTLIHGDLLGQNVLVHPEAPPAVLDWEYAGLGDPAYDLAVVTRGKPKPFDLGNGFALLIKAYAANGGKRIQASEVRVHELCLVARWYQETAAEKGEESATHILGQLRNVLRRARAEATAAVPSREPTDALARERAELFRAVGELAGKVGSAPLREALAKSFAMTADASLRDGYDEARREVDAFLRAKQEGTSAVREPEGFVPSPEVSEEGIDDIAKHLCAASNKPRH